MEVRLLSYTQINPALTSMDDLGDVAAMLGSQTGTAQERLAEFAARVCYRSTDKMGHNPTFVQARVREGHEDIIEHVTFVVLVSSVPSSQLLILTPDWGLRTDLPEADGPVRWRLINRHLEVTPWEGGWVVSGNARVWLDLFRRGLALDVLPLLRPIAPTIYAEFDADQVVDKRGLGTDDQGLRTEDRGLRTEDREPRTGVTLLAYTQPLITEPALAADHNTATFLIEGISRVCSHQIVRHRLASISQESQRYSDLEKGGWEPVIPPEIAARPEAKAILDQAWESLTKAYARLRALGIRKEDARFLLPGAAETRLVITMNFRAWAHFCRLRCDKAAQWEIRAVAYEILRQLYALAPKVLQELHDTFLANTPVG